MVLRKVDIHMQKNKIGDFPSGPVLRICLPIWETQVLSLAQEDSTSQGQLNPCA